MDRTYSSGAAGSAPIAPASPSSGYPTAGNPATATPATKPGPYWYHMIMEELMAVITSAGIAPAQGTLTQLASAIQSGKLFSSAAAGTADALTASYVPAVAALVNGMLLYIRPGSANASTTPTFTPNSGVIAAKTIVKGAGAALAAGDIAGVGHWIGLQYDLTLDKWVLLNPATGVGGVQLNQANTWTKAQRGAVVALADGATITSDFSVGNNFEVTLAGNRTLANPTNVVAGQSGIIKVSQDATGGRTLAFGSYFKFAGGTAVTMTTTANAVDDLSYYVESATRILVGIARDVK